MNSALNPVVNIWIHGTFPQDFISIKLHDKAVLKYIVNLYYCPPGLHKVEALPEKYNYCKLTRAMSTADSTLFPLEHFYLFGWSGKLNEHGRDAAGAILYEKISSLIDTKYAQKKPFIRVLGHSHGGNVALSMAKKVHENPLFFIDELLMLATPAHKATVDCITSPLFKKIYSIHSHIDMIQVMDPQGMPELKNMLKKLFSSFNIADIKEAFSAFEQKSFFSERHFPEQPNLKNIRLLFNGRDVFHTEYLLPSFAQRMPLIVKVLEEEPGAQALVRGKDEWILDIK